MEPACQSGSNGREALLLGRDGEEGCWRGVLERVFRAVLYGSAVTNPTNIHEDEGSIPGLAQWVKDPVLLWLWQRLAATALILPQAWGLAYAVGVALKKTKRKKGCLEENSWHELPL